MEEMFEEVVISDVEEPEDDSLSLISMIINQAPTKDQMINNIHLMAIFLEDGMTIEEACLAVIEGLPAS